MKKFLSLLLLSSLVLGTILYSGSPTAPVPNEVEAADLYTETAVSVPSTKGNYEIPAVLTLPAGNGPFPLVAMCHGFAGNKDENIGYPYIAKELAQQGIASIRMDYIGSGDSKVDFVNFSIASAANDTVDCVNYAIKNAAIDKNRVGVFGYSNGGPISSEIILKNKNLFKCRVLLAPAVYPDDMDVEEAIAEQEELIAVCEANGYVEMPWFGRTLHVGKANYESKINCLENIAKYEAIRMDTLVIYGAKDTTVPALNSATYAAKVGADAVCVAKADHGYGFYDEKSSGLEVLDIVTDSTVSFFRTRLTANRAKNKVAW